MKTGDKIPVVLLVTDPVKDGEQIEVGGKMIEVNNTRGNKWWSVPFGTSGPRIMVCDDGDTECRLIGRRAIVDLIECGVA